MAAEQGCTAAPPTSQVTLPPGIPWPADPPTWGADSALHPAPPGCKMPPHSFHVLVAVPIPSRVKYVQVLHPPSYCDLQVPNVRFQLDLYTAGVSQAGLAYSFS